MVEPLTSALFTIGIANNAFFLVLLTSASLWAASGLQVLYIVLSFAGWWQWLRGRADTGTTVVRQSSRAELAWCAVFLVPGAWMLYVILTAAHDATPVLDAVTTCLSLIAQRLLNTRRTETWYFWIAASCIFIPLYLSQGLSLTAAVCLPAPRPVHCRAAPPTSPHSPLRSTSSNDSIIQMLALANEGLRSPTKFSGRVLCSRPDRGARRDGRSFHALDLRVPKKSSSYPVLIGCCCEFGEVKAAGSRSR
ncbi:nicotinamide riboside transporter PnuC [Mycobacterium sp. 134]|uniref:nicotinamide riboside transporter PnuC n=1 Tax=Mycobacterium sp. 134 TaxID=3400425 RepID=UPI003AB00883